MDAPLSPFEIIAQEVGALVTEKNRAYGSSFNVAGEFVKLLWPKGVPPESYGDMLALVRVFDKMKRIATDQDAFGEDPWRDVAGYALLSIERRQREKGALAAGNPTAEGAPSRCTETIRCGGGGGATTCGEPRPCVVHDLGGVESPEDGGQNDPSDWNDPPLARWLEEELAAYRRTLEHWVEPQVAGVSTEDAVYMWWEAGEGELRATLHAGQVTWSATQHAAQRPAWVFGKGTDGRQKAWAWFLHKRGLAQVGELGAPERPTAGAQASVPVPLPAPELHPCHVRCQARGADQTDACWGRRKYELSTRQTEPGFEAELTRILDAEGWSPQRVTADGRTFPPKGRACPPCWSAWSEAEARRQAEAQQEHDQQAAEMEDLARYLRVQGYEAAVYGPGTLTFLSSHVRVAITMGGSTRFLVTLGFVRVSPGGGCTSSYAGHGAPDSVPMAKAWLEGKGRAELAVAKFYEERGQGHA